MFIARALYAPVPGRGPRLAKVLESYVRPGERMSLTQRLSGPVVYSFNWAVEDLKELEQLLTRPLPAPDPANPMDALMAATPDRELWETVVALPPGPNPAFISRFTYEAAQGEAGALRQLVETFITERNSAGGRSGVQVKVYGGAQAVATVNAFADLASLEATRARAIADPAGQRYTRALASVLARPSATPDVFRTLAGSLMR